MEKGFVQGTLESLYDKAKSDYDFWALMVDQYGYNTDLGITMSQYYGRLAGIVDVEKILIGNGECSKKFENVEFKFYEEDFSEEES